MKKMISSGIVMIAIFVMLSGVAQALSLKYLGIHKATLVDVSINNGVYETVYAGEMKVTLLDENGHVVDGKEWLTAFCVDPGNPIWEDEVLSHSIQPSAFHPGSEVGLQAAWLFDTYYRETASVEEMAGLQIALWEVVKDSGYDLEAGDFRTRATVGWEDDYTEMLYYGDLYLSSLSNALPLTDTARLDRDYTIFKDDKLQDLIVRTPVPEPTTLLLLAGGVMVLIGLKRKWGC